MTPAAVACLKCHWPPTTVEPPHTRDNINLKLPHNRRVETGRRCQSCILLVGRHQLDSVQQTRFIINFVFELYNYGNSHTLLSHTPDDHIRWLQLRHGPEETKPFKPSRLESRTSPPAPAPVPENPASSKPAQYFDAESAPAVTPPADNMDVTAYVVGNIPLTYYKSAPSSRPATD